MYLTFLQIWKFRTTTTAQATEVAAFLATPELFRAVSISGELAMLAMYMYIYAYVYIYTDINTETYIYMF